MSHPTGGPGSSSAAPPSASAESSSAESPPAGSSSPDNDPYARVAAVVGAVARQALADRGLARIVLLDDGGAQARLAARMLVAALGDAAVGHAALWPEELDPLLPLYPGLPHAEVAREARRMRARLMPGALAADPANKTELLLGGDLPPEPLLPLGDLWASDVLRLGAQPSLSAEIHELAKAAGGVDALDAALRRRIDGRDPRGLDGLPSAVAEEIGRRLARGSASRRTPRIVPKLGSRTLGLDLLE
jgi:hypothetical protein